MTRRYEDNVELLRREFQGLLRPPITIALQPYTLMPTLEWLTRETDVRAAAHVPYRLLEADPSLSYGDELTENMLVQGDNLEALKALATVLRGPREVHLHRSAIQHPQRLRALR